uniref:Transposase n=1 Tax=Ditylenchus dipsaci TaxID=166011 RepID=A0A915CMI0_9BILA
MFLGLREMDKDHTAKNILTATEELLGKFDLSLDSIFKIVTDNGSNVVAAFKDIQIIDFNTEYVDDDDDDKDYDEGNLSNIPDESILLEAFPQRISCFAHSLQLVILKFFKDDVIYFSGYKKMMDVVKKVKISPKLKKELHERCGATVKLPSTTRWGSLIEVIRQFLEVKQSLGEIQSLKTLMPTAEEIHELQVILQIFRPFVAVLKRIQAEKSVSISHVVYNESLRPAIIRAHEAGHGVREIARFLDIRPMMVSRAINRFEETGSNKDRTGRGPKKTAFLNYSVWSIHEEKACKKPHPNVGFLKKALKKAWKGIYLEALAKMVDNFPKRLKACINANGDHPVLFTIRRRFIHRPSERGQMLDVHVLSRLSLTTPTLLYFVGLAQTME